MKSNQKISLSQGKYVNEFSKEALMDNIPLEYKILYAEGTYLDSYSVYNELEEEVNEKLKNGWVLYGGVSIGYISDEHFSVCQAMVKYGDTQSDMSAFTNSLSERK